eukprot:3174689-Alexandrium_andersonii.AAC.1
MVCASNTAIRWRTHATTLQPTLPGRTKKGSGGGKWPVERPAGRLLELLAVSRPELRVERRQGQG